MNDYTVINNTIFRGENIKLFAYFLRKYSKDIYFPDLLQTSLERFESKKHLYDAARGKLSLFILKICQSAVSEYLHKFARSVTIPRHANIANYSDIRYDRISGEAHRDYIFGQYINHADSVSYSTESDKIKPIIVSILGNYFKVTKTYNIAIDLFCNHPYNYKLIAQKYNISVERANFIYNIGIVICRAHLNEYNELTTVNHFQKRLATMTIDEIEKEASALYISNIYNKTQIILLYQISSRERQKRLFPNRKKQDIYNAKLGCTNYSEFCIKINKEYINMATNSKLRFILLSNKYDIPESTIRLAIAYVRSSIT